MSDTPHNQSGGVNVNADRASVGGDAVGRDKTEQHATNTTFDQRGQNVSNQYNAGGNLTVVVNPPSSEQQVANAQVSPRKKETRSFSLSSDDLPTLLIGSVTGLLAGVVTKLGTTLLNDQNPFFFALIVALFCGSAGALAVVKLLKPSKRGTHYLCMILGGFAGGLIGIAALLTFLGLLLVIAMGGLLWLADYASRQNKSRSSSDLSRLKKDMASSVRFDNDRMDNAAQPTMSSSHRNATNTPPHKRNWWEGTGAMKSSADSSGSPKKSVWSGTKARHDSDKHK